MGFVKDTVARSIWVTPGVGTVFLLRGTWCRSHLLQTPLSLPLVPVLFFLAFFSVRLSRRHFFPDPIVVQKYVFPDVNFLRTLFLCKNMFFEVKSYIFFCKNHQIVSFEFKFIKIISNIRRTAKKWAQQDENWIFSKSEIRGRRRNPQPLSTKIGFWCKNNQKSCFQGLGTSKSNSWRQNN